MKRILLTAAFAVLLTGAAFAAEIGTVDASNGLRLRAEANSGSATIAIAPHRAEVLVLSTENGWCAVEYDGKAGFMSSDYLTLSATSSFETAMDGNVTGSVVNVRSAPSTSSVVVLQLKLGTTVSVSGVDGGWYAVSYGNNSGFIHPDYLTVTPRVATSAAAQPSDKTTPESTADTSSIPAPDSPETLSAARSELVEFAKQYIGTKYMYGGRSAGGFDCSGYVYFVFKNFGHTLNPGASNQMDSVTAIKKSELLPGDLVFFNNGSGRRASHVGIYLGDNRFIHARSPGKTLGIDSMASGYYNKYYVGAGRVLPVE